MGWVTESPTQAGVYTSGSKDPDINVMNSTFGLIPGTDNTIALQKAINALDNGSSIIGTLRFPYIGQPYNLNGSLVIGDGSKYVGIHVIGQPAFGGENSQLSTVQLVQSSATLDTLQVAAPLNKSHNIVIEGLQILHPASSSGTGINLGPPGGSQHVGTVINSCSIANAGTGIHIAGAVSVKIRDTTLIGSRTAGSGSGAGLLCDNVGCNVLQLENVVMQNCAIGALIKVVIFDLRCDSVVFESDTDADLKLDATGALINASFDGSHWEFTAPNGMILLTSTAGYIAGITFDGCHFDGSGNNRDCMVIQGGAHAGPSIQNVTWSGCQFVNMGTGRITTCAQAPTNSDDPRFLNLNVLGNYLQNTNNSTFFGIPPRAIAPNQFSLFQPGITTAMIDASGAYGTPAYLTLDRGSLGFSVATAGQGDGAPYQQPLVLNSHLISGQTATPASSALGANVTSVTPSGNDTRGELTIVMAGALAANTRIATITFATTYGATAPKVILVDQTSAVGIGLVNFYVSAQSTGVSFDIASDQALGAGTYKVDYIVIG